MVKTTFQLIRKLAYVLLLAAMLVISFGTPSYANPASGEVIFHTKKNYEGEATTYKINESYQAECKNYNDNINDKYLSVEIGSEAKVVVWEHCNNTGIKDEWTESKPDISCIDGFSKFRVTNKTDAVLAFRLIDETSSKIPLTLFIQTFGIESGQITDSTIDENDDYRIIGILPTNSGGEPNVTGVYLLEVGGKTLSQGAVYFKWNTTTKKVELISYEGTKPPGFDIKQTSATRFDFHWIGTEEGLSS